MNTVFYYLFLLTVRLVSLFPFSVLYRFSDATSFLLFRVIKYRRNVVFQNLKNAFPEKSTAERTLIAKKFYDHFSDLIYESIKMYRLSDEQIRQRISYSNKQVLLDLYKKNKHVVVVIGHYGNWEWIAGLAGQTPYNDMSIYKPMRNKYFDHFFKNLRAKYGLELVPMRQTIRKILTYKKENRLTLSAFISDQSPVWEETQYWTEFLNQDTAVYLGIEKIAKQTDQAVVFYATRKVKRGYYEVEVIPLFEETRNLPPYTITDSHVQTMEKLIKERPEHWLWSHRRWKLTERKQNNGKKLK